MPLAIITQIKAKKPIVRKLLLLLMLLSVTGMTELWSQTRTVYKIQVASHPREYSIERIQRDLGISDDLTMHYIKGRFKYFVGAYPTRAAAQSDVAGVPVQGAWVVPVEVPVEAAQETQEVIKEVQPEDTISGVVEQTTEIVYRIQVAADKRFIDPERIKSDLALSDYAIDYHFVNGWYKYVLGDFASQEEAEKFRVDSNLTGFVVQAPIQRVIASSDPEQAEDSVAVAGDGGVAADTVDEQADEYRRNLELQYQRFVDLGDQAFTTGEYSSANDYYQRASNIDPTQSYPKQRIAEIRNLEEQQKGNQLSSQLRWFLFAVLVFTLVLVIVLVFTLILRTRRKRLEGRTEKLRDEVQDSVTEYLFDENAARPEMVDGLRSSRDKQVLIDEIMQLYSNLSGEISNRLRELYIDLGLDNESVQKTQSPQWHIRAKGFRELAQMNIKTVNQEIEKCLNSDNDVLRMEAQLAMIRLNYEQPFSFLEKLEKPFTSWEQLHVYEMITRHQITPPDFSQWVDSPNESVVVFSIRMIRAFKQNEGYEQLYPLMEHQNLEIREEAIITLGELRITETLPVLKQRYLVEDQHGKMLILQAMSKMPEEENIDFLQSILEPSNALRLEAAEALSRIESFGVKGIETILRRSDDDLQAVARHILDSKTR